MKKRTGILGVLIAILVMAVGYAAITAIPLQITGTGTIVPDQDNFQVIFVDEDHEITPATSPATLTAEIDPSDETKATLSVTGLNMTNETATFTFVVQNISPENIIADLQAPTLTFTNEEYFDVTAELGAETEIGVGEEATITVTVRVKKATLDDITSDITVTVNANPVLG